MTDSRRRLLPVLALVLFAAVLLAPSLLLGEVFFFRDFGRFYRPVKTFFLDRLLDGEFPIWMPEWNCGTPVHGELVHGFLYPGNLLLLPGGGFGWGLYFAFHVVFAGLATRALARRLGAEEEGALLAGIAFAGSGYLVAQMNHVPYLTAAAWSPLIVLLGLSTAAGRRGALPLLAAAFAASALAGEPFTLLLTIVLLLVLVLAGVGGARRIPGLLRIGVAGGVALLVASPALLPALETLAQTVRAAGFAEQEGGFGSLHPARLATLFGPELLGRLQHSFALDHEFLGREFSEPEPVLLAVHLGAVPLLLLAFAPFRRSRAARTLVIVAAVALLLALGSRVGLSTLLAEVVPGLSLFRYPDKYWLLATLSVALLAGLAAARTGRGATVLAAAGAAVALLLGVAFGKVGAGLAGAAPFALAAVATRAAPERRVRLLTAVLAAELLFFGIRLNATEDPARLSPRNGIGAPLAEHGPGRIFAEFGFQGVPSVLLARSLEPLGGVPEGFVYSFAYDPVEPIGRVLYYLHAADAAPREARRVVFHRLLRLVSNRYSVTNSDLRRDPALRPLFEGERGIRAFEYVDPAPRARLYGDTLVVPDVATGQAVLADVRFDPFRMLMLEGDVEREAGGVPRGDVRIVEEDRRRVVVHVSSDRAAWLFLADAMAPGWRATVDGRPAPIRTAFLAFRAVRVPAGASEVEFRYEPDWLRSAPWSFGLGLLLLLALAGHALRPGRRTPPTAPPSA